MPSYKFTGTNAEGGVTFGGKRFDRDVPVDVSDPSLAAKLEGNAEFERVSGPSEGEAPVWSPPGPTPYGTGPGSGPAQTTNEVIDQNPNPDAGQPTPEEMEEEQRAADARAADGSATSGGPRPGDVGPEVEPTLTDEGPKRKRSKSEPHEGA